jgi:nucleoside-diphosphate-sugar epimerase
MNIAITGATGFIGSELVKKNLELGNSVSILTRRDNTGSLFPGKVQIIKGDLSNRNSELNLLLKNTDVLFHCAAEITSPEKMFDVNVKGTLNLINAAAGRINRWVQLSSTGVYGNPTTGIIDETIPENPRNEYEKTKLLSDKLVIEAGENNKFAYSILRPSNVFGATMKNQSLFQLIKSIDKGFYIPIGTKGASANYVPVENVIEALVLCGNHANALGKTFIVSDWTTIDNFTLLIAKELNKKIPSIRLPKNLLKAFALAGYFIPKFPLSLSRINALTNKSRYSSARISEYLDYKTAVNLEEGIQRMVEAYLSKSKTSY